MLACLLTLWFLGLAHAERPSVPKLVPDELTDALETSDRLSPTEMVEVATQATTELKNLEADIQRVGAKEPDCVKAPLQVIATLRTVAASASTALGTAIQANDRSRASSSLRRLLIALVRGRELHARVVTCAADEGNLNADVSLSVEYLGEGDDQETFSDTLDLFDANGNPLDVVDVETDGGDAPPEASPFI
jgi:hypothetical protein